MKKFLSIVAFGAIMMSASAQTLKVNPAVQGTNTVTITASELPAGMYLYTLVVDNVVIDSKRLILTQ